MTPDYVKFMNDVVFSVVFNQQIEHNDSASINYDVIIDDHRYIDINYKIEKPIEFIKLNFTITEIE